STSQRPCSSSTAGPPLGPSSTYPTFKRPASICRTGPNDVGEGRFVAVPFVDAGGFYCARAAAMPMSAAANDKVAALRNRRRVTWRVFDIFHLCGEFSIAVKASPLDQRVDRYDRLTRRSPVVRFDATVRGPVVRLRARGVIAPAIEPRFWLALGLLPSSTE